MSLIKRILGIKESILVWQLDHSKFVRLCQWLTRVKLKGHSIFNEDELVALGFTGIFKVDEFLDYFNGSVFGAVSKRMRAKYFFAMDVNMAQYQDEVFDTLKEHHEFGQGLLATGLSKEDLQPKMNEWAKNKYIEIMDRIKATAKETAHA